MMRKKLLQFGGLCQIAGFICTLAVSSLKNIPPTPATDFLQGFFLGLFGGLSGVLAALALTPVINYLNFAMPPAPGLKLTWLLNITLTVSGVIAAFIMSIVTGTIASLYRQYHTFLSWLYYARHRRSSPCLNLLGSY